MEILVSDIEVGPRKRHLDTVKVAELASSILEIGLLQPVTVRRVNGHYRLVAGAHRLEAFRIMKRDCIPAEVFQGDDLAAELAEIDENLRRAELTVLEQGEHLARRDDILRGRGLRAPHGRPTEKGVTVTPLVTTADLAEEIGMSESSIKQRKQIANDIEPDIKDLVRNSPIANSTTKLLELARTAPDEQAAVADRMLVHYSSATPEWYSPPSVIERTVELLGTIDLDPCSNDKDNPRVPAGQHYTKDDDGLAQTWSGRVYMNPPYGREISDWIEHLVEQYEAGEVLSAVALVPSRTDTEWFHHLRDYPRCFVKGRLSFSDNENPAPFPSMVVYLGRDVEGFVQVFGDMGDVFARTN